MYCRGSTRWQDITTVATAMAAWPLVSTSAVNSLVRNRPDHISQLMTSNIYATINIIQTIQRKIFLPNTTAFICYPPWRDNICYLFKTTIWNEFVYWGLDLRFKIHMASQLSSSIDNGFVCRQTNSWTNADLLSIGYLGIKFGGVWTNARQLLINIIKFETVICESSGPIGEILLNCPEIPTMSIQISEA